MYEAVYRVVLMVRKPMPGKTFEEALAAAQELITPSLWSNFVKNNAIKGALDDHGAYLVSVEEQGAYSTE